MIITDRFKIDCKIDFLSIMILDLTAKVNNHAYVKIRGVCCPCNYDCHLGEKINISIQDETDSEPLFSGIIIKETLSSDDFLHIADLECVSVSYKFDDKRNSRFFQSKKQSYRSILNNISGKGKSILGIEKNLTESANPIIQFEETDWDFIKRIACLCNTIVIPDIYDEYPQIAVGIILGKKHEITEKIEYRVNVNLELFRLKKCQCKSILNDFIYYTINYNENFNLGDKVLFNSMELCVLEKKVILEKGMLRAAYVLGKKEICISHKPYNDSIKGLSLKCKVLSASGEKIKVNSDFNEKDEELSNLYEYDYVPISGNVMYSMPEVNSEVMLYFMDSDLKNMPIVYCCHNNIDNNRLEAEKELITLSKKQLKMDESHILFGNSKKSLNLKDDSKIELYSDKKIKIGANEIILESLGGAALQSGINILFEVFKSGDTVDISGNDIAISTSKMIQGGSEEEIINNPKNSHANNLLPSMDSYYDLISGALSFGELKQQEAFVIAGIPNRVGLGKVNSMSQFIGVTRER